MLPYLFVILIFIAVIAIALHLETYTISGHILEI